MSESFMFHSKSIRILGLLGFLCAFPLFVSSQTQPEVHSSVIFQAKGNVEVHPQQGDSFDPVALLEDFYRKGPLLVPSGSRVATGKESFAELSIEGKGVIRLNEESEIQLPPVQPSEGENLKHLRGKLFMNIDSAALSRQGTEFRVSM